MTYLINSSRFAVSGGGGGGSSSWNPSDKGADVTLSNSNRTAAYLGGGAGNTSVRATVSQNTTGKFYYECVLQSTDPGGNAQPKIGVANSVLSLNSSVLGTAIANNSCWWLDCSGASFVHDPTGAFTFVGLPLNTNGNVYQVAVDFAAAKIWWGCNGTFDGSPSAGTGARFTNIAGTLFPFVCLASSTNASQVTGNFVTANFAFTPPTGFGQW